jgi:tetratricopeptide (TPR) repeat protein
VAKATGKPSTSKTANRPDRKAVKATVSKSPRSAPASRNVRPTRAGKKLSRRKAFQAQIIVSAPAPPPEPPRRVVSTAAVKAFEHAVKVFHRRHYADAKKMFEEIAQRYSPEVEIAARTQTFLQICRQKLAHAQSVPRNADELYDRGVFALNVGDFTQARTFFEKSLRLKPDEPHVLYSLAATHAQSGASDLALDYLSRSIQIQPRFRSQALQDDDFSLLREDRRFIELTGVASPFDLLEARH